MHSAPISHAVIGGVGAPVAAATTQVLDGSATNGIRFALTANCVITLQNLVPGLPYTIRCQQGAGAFTLGYAGAYTWLGKVPVVDTTTSLVTTIVLMAISASEIILLAQATTTNGSEGPTVTPSVTGPLNGTLTLQAGLDTDTPVNPDRENIIVNLGALESVSGISGSLVLSHPTVGAMTSFAIVGTGGTDTPAYVKETVNATMGRRTEISGGDWLLESIGTADIYFDLTGAGSSFNVRASGGRIVVAANGDITVGKDNTQVLNVNVPTQTTIGANGAASALTALPVGYIRINVNGSSRIIPYYNP